MTAVVIPAHNEAATIGQTLAAVFGAPDIEQVIVVADDCTDDTGLIAITNGAHTFYSQAGDKGTAMAAGLVHVTSDRVLFLDADLRGLRAEHVEALCLVPPVDGMVVGIRDGTPGWGLPSLSGERRLPSAFARTIPLAGAGYRAELAISDAVGRAGLPVRHYEMVGVTNPSREWRHPLMFADLALYALLHAGGLWDYTRAVARNVPRETLLAPS